MDHKSKKAFIRARNKRDYRINTQQHQLDEDAARIQANEEALQRQSEPSSDETPGTEVWSAKLQEVRNRLTNKKRKARDRWNRFAGTSGSGGHGR